ncbi:unnamed protein product, partial [Phaeothamnion confervicola]
TVVLAFLEFLKRVDRGSLVDASQLDDAIASLEASFGVIGDAEDDENFSYKPLTLEEVYAAGIRSLNAKSFAAQLKEARGNETFHTLVKSVTAKGYFKGVEEGTPEYQDRLAKLVFKFQQRIKAPTAAATTATAATPMAVGESADAPAADGDGASDAAKESAAEEAKARGNVHIAKQEYDDAARCYSEAINLSPAGPSSHIFFCNRAAAYCYLGRYKDAVEDCLNSVDLNQNYVKAFSRLGFAHFKSEDWAAAVKAYTRALELEPGNAANRDYLKQAQAKLRAADADASGSGGAARGGGGGRAGDGGMPDLSALLGAMGGGGGGGGGRAGGMGSLAGLMNNPHMQSMAQNMMQNPAMMEMAQNMMKDPEMMQKAMGMMGGAGAGMDPAAMAAMMGGIPGGVSGGTPAGGSG